MKIFEYLREQKKNKQRENTESEIQCKQDIF